MVNGNCENEMFDKIPDKHRQSILSIRRASVAVIKMSKKKLTTLHRLLFVCVSIECQD